MANWLIWQIDYGKLAYGKKAYGETSYSHPVSAIDLEFLPENQNSSVKMILN